MTTTSAELPPILDEPIAALTGTLRAYERPEHVPLEAWLAFTQEEMAALVDPVVEVENIVVNLWFADILNLMVGQGAQQSMLVGVLAVGTGNLPGGAVARTDTVLVQELKRYPLLTSSVSLTDPVSAVLTFFIPAADGAMSLTEAGLFHAGATITPGTGRMSSHSVFVYPRTGPTDTTVTYTLTRSLT